MTSYTRIVSPLSAPQRLDSCTLGRPVHLLPQVAEELREALNQALRHSWNRRYRTRHEVVAASLQPFDPAVHTQEVGDRAGRWLQTKTPARPLACWIERRYVLNLMNHRLGLAPPATETLPPTPDDTPETATEERLLHALARSFSERCQHALRALSPTAETDDDTLADSAGTAGWLPVTQPRMPAGAWVLKFQVHGQDLPNTQVLLAFEGHAMDGVLRTLAAANRSTRTETSPVPLSRRLHLTLKAQLLERQMTLHEVLQLRQGALIPVHLGQASVQADGNTLFQAQVAEHQGKLCLTSFQDME